MITCQLCGSNGFESRNKLFKHLKICSLPSLIKDSNLKSLQDNANHTISKNYIYVTGGRVRGRTLGSVERYSLEDNKWESCSYMMENRGSHGAAAFKSQLFILGGGGFRSNLATCESLNAINNQWKPIAPMQTYRHALAVVGMNVPDVEFVKDQSIILITSSHTTSGDLKTL